MNSSNSTRGIQYFNTDRMEIHVPRSQYIFGGAWPTLPIDLPRRRPMRILFTVIVRYSVVSPHKQVNLERLRYRRSVIVWLKMRMMNNKKNVVNEMHCNLRPPRSFSALITTPIQKLKSVNWLTGITFYCWYLSLRYDLDLWPFGLERLQSIVCDVIELLPNFSEIEQSAADL